MGLTDGLGKGDGDGSGLGSGAGVGVGEGAYVSYVQTESRGFTDDVLGTDVTSGLLNVGTLSPPCIMATVPLGDTYTIFALADVAVAGVHVPLQK